MHQQPTAYMQSVQAHTATAHLAQCHHRVGNECNAQAEGSHQGVAAHELSSLQQQRKKGMQAIVRLSARMTAPSCNGNAGATTNTPHHTSLLHCCYMLIVAAAEECCWGMTQSQTIPIAMQGDAATQQAARAAGPMQTKAQQLLRHKAHSPTATHCSDILTMTRIVCSWAELLCVMSRLRTVYSQPR
jgi:hypothetical protein